MRLKKIVRLADSRTFDFVRLRSDGVELDSLEITVDEDSAITRIEIRDNIEGSCAVAAQGHLVHCTAWESEAEAQESSHWSKHYTQRMGTQPGEMQDALRIFQNLERCIYDTYLKHILRIFPGAAKSIEFDGDLYAVYEPPPKRPSFPALDLVEETQPPKISICQRLRAYFAKSGLVLLSFVGTVLILIVGSVFLYHRPPELPPKTAEMFKMQDAELLPMYNFVRQDIENTLVIYAREIEKKLEPFAEPSEAIDFNNEQDFLDRLYPLDEAVQLSTYQDKIMKNPALTDQRRARILYLLYSENLMHVISSYPHGLTLMAYNYLRHQLPKAVISRYMLYLLRHHDGTAVAVEAHFILQSLAEIQLRVIELIFFQREINELCLAGKFEWHKFPNEEITICEVRQRYSLRITKDQSELQKMFEHFSDNVLARALKTGRTSYRRGDILYKRAVAKIESADDPNAMQQAIQLLSQIYYPVDDHGDIFRAEYAEMRTMVSQKTQDLIDLRQRAELQARLDRLVHEADNIRATMPSAGRTLNKIKSLARDISGKRKGAALKALTEREDKLLPKKTEMKIQF